MKTLKNINQITQQTYDMVAEVYHELYKDEMLHKAYDRKILDKFSQSLSNNSIIYDIGCGPSGHIGYYLFEKGYDVVGVDISEKCIAMASKYHPEMKFIKMDMTNLELEDNSIDGIIAYYSIIHIPKRYISKIFQEFHRVLRAGGKLLVVVKEGDQEGLQEELLGLKTQIYFTLFRQEEIIKYYIENGFKILFNQKRSPYEDEISLSRIYAIGEK
jgi:ubiquinone/menaquinone biosynthesis C-methylase UbiE